MIPTALLLFCLPLVYAQPPTEPPNSASSCPNENGNSSKIVACKDFKLFNFAANDVAKLSLTSNEGQIAAEGHWEGVKPDHYRMTLNFTNATIYEGAVAIDITVTTPTNKIFVHIGPKITVDYSAIFVQQKDCKPGQPAPKEPVCIESVGVVSGQTLIFIQLSGNLISEAKYMIGIPKFRAEVGFYNPSNRESVSSGVFWSDSDNNGQLRPGVPAALSTVFRLREARNVFPCFDHPRLKARFTLCMEYPDDLLPVSNTPIRASVGDNKGLRRKRTCFETTPPISTYVFTFSLLHEYDTEQRLVDTELVVELLSPKGHGVLYRWMYDAVIEPMRFMGGSTRFRYPLKRVAFLMMDSYPYAGVENFGLITLNAKLVKGPSPDIPGRVLVNHEIVHQWFGGIVTMSDWKEICVQEGLTAYYEWAMTAQTLKAATGSSQNLTVSERARRALASFADDYNPFVREFQSNREIIDTCYGVPPLFFKTLADAFGDQTFYRLFAEVTAAFQFDNADVDAWDEALAKATGRQDLHNYIRAWFTLPGYARLFISQVGNSVELVQAFSSGVRPIFVRILQSSSKSGQAESAQLIDKQSAVLPLSAQSAAWFLINADDDASPVRKIYNLEHYKRFLACNATRPDDCAITAQANTLERRKIAGKDFCVALLEDRFPWGPDDESLFNAEGWKDLFQAYVEKGELDGDCECCLRSKEQLKNAGQRCVAVWNAKCRNLRINRQLGRAYSVGDL